jgi:rod shape-determining protein MreC
MQQLISFIQKYKYLLFFVILQSIAIHLTIRNNNFHKSAFLNSTNFITGGLYNKTAHLSNYFQLGTQNQLLVEENEILRNRIALLCSQKDTLVDIDQIDSVQYHQKYTYTSGKIIKNEYHKLFNYLLIDKGNSSGISKEMAVFNHKGIIGITEKTTKKYTRVQSILNKNSKISARLKNGSNYFGPLVWDGKDYRKVQLTDIPRQANVKVGDTIVTSGRSTIFPEGILVGTVLKVGNNSSADNKISVQLFNDMSNLRHVYIVKNLHKIELNTLENE